MYNTTRGNEGNEETIESTNEPPTTSATHVKPRKSHPPLSLLGNPSYDFLNVNYTKVSYRDIAANYNLEVSGQRKIN